MGLFDFVSADDNCVCIEVDYLVYTLNKEGF